MNKTILFIVEGEDKDYRFVNNMTNLFLKGKYKTEIINIPAKQNIYMLYQILKNDDFESDFLEIIRDNIKGAKEILDGVTRQSVDEIYLFFDYDVHQDNYHNDDNILLKLLETFDNETENGKLFISYPMVEALYDYVDDQCEVFTDCFVDLVESRNYKRISGLNNPKANIHFEYAEWKSILNVYSLRIRCLFRNIKMDFNEYRNMVNPLSIYDREKENEVFVLSAFPEFLFDYFGVDFWNSHAAKVNKKMDECSIKQL